MSKGFQRADQDFVSGTRVNLRAYAVFAVSGSSEPWSGFTITARVENATDRAYAEVLNFPASRRSLFVGGQLAR